MPTTSDDRDHHHTRNGEAALLRRLRIIIALVVVVLLIFAVCVDALGRLFIDPTFHVSEVVIGGLTGAALLAGGVAASTSVTLPGGWEIKRKPPSEEEEKTK